MTTMVGAAYVPPPGVLSCSRCGFRAASDRNMIRASFGLQCPRCRAIVSYPSMTAADVAPADPNPYVSATFLGVVTPDDVGAEKRSIEPYAEETNLKASLAKNLPQALASAWKDFYVSWKDFYASPTLLPTAGISYKKALEFRSRLFALQRSMNPYFSEPATLVPMPNETPPGAATDPGPPGHPPTSIFDQLMKASDKWSTAITVTVIVGGGLAAWLIYQQARNADRLSERIVPQLPALLAL